MSNRAGHYVRGVATAPKLVAPRPRRPVLYARRPGDLTDRQKQILTLTACGLTNAQIGARLYLSVDTVKTHIVRTRQVLGASNAAHAVAIAITRGFITFDLSRQESP